MKKCIMVLIVFLLSMPAAEAAITNTTVKIIPIWLPLIISIGTNKLEAEPGEILNIKAYARNAYNESMKNVTIWFENETNVTAAINPTLIEELKPNEIRSFDVVLTIPKDIKEGYYLLEMRGVSSDFSNPIEEKISLKITLIKTEIYYATLVVCIVILSLFLWRRLTYNRKKS